MVGVCAYPHLCDLSQREQSQEYSVENQCSDNNSNESLFSSAFDTYAERMQQQYDITDALTSYGIGTRNQDNRVRTRRYEHISSLLQMRLHTQPLQAILHRIAVGDVHLLNRIVAQSYHVPLNLPPEKISYPFHSFW